jgi:hypothetical protein
VRRVPSDHRLFGVPADLGKEHVEPLTADSTRDRPDLHQAHSIA